MCTPSAHTCLLGNICKIHNVAWVRECSCSAVAEEFITLCLRLEIRRWPKVRYKANIHTKYPVFHFLPLFSPGFLCTYFWDFWLISSLGFLCCKWRDRFLPTESFFSGVPTEPVWCTPKRRLDFARFDGPYLSPFVYGHLKRHISLFLKTPALV